MNTRRYPRTLQEAFGPYADSRIEEPQDTGYSSAWWIAVSICSVVAAVVIAMTNGAPQ